MARPKPDAPPVTIATLSLSFMVGSPAPGCCCPTLARGSRREGAISLGSRNRGLRRGVDAVHADRTEANGQAQTQRRRRLELPTHGAAVLPSVRVDSYNLEVQDEDGFVGDKASKGAFWEILDKWRKLLKEARRGPARRQADRGDEQEEAGRRC